MFLLVSLHASRIDRSERAEWARVEPYSGVSLQVEVQCSTVIGEIKTVRTLESLLRKMKPNMRAELLAVDGYEGTVRALARDVLLVAVDVCLQLLLIDRVEGTEETS